MNYIKAYEEYLLFEKNLSEKTIETYKAQLYKFLVFLAENELKINTIKKENVRDYLEYLYEIGNNDKTVSLNITVLKSFYKFLNKDGFTENNPTLTIVQNKVQKKIPQTLTSKEVDKILNSIDINDPIGFRNRTLIEFLFTTGCRVSELCDLRVNQLIFEEGHAKIKGKGSKERIIFLGDILIDYLSKYLNHYRNELLKNKNSDYVFVGKSSIKLDRTYIYRMIQNYVDKAGIDKRIGPHTFRHSFATELLKNNVDLVSIKEMLGHQNISTTQIYTHLNQKAIINKYNNSHPFGKETVTNMKYKRIFLIVMDSAGVGHAKDPQKFSDSPESNTFLNIDKNTDGLHLPTLEKLGLGFYDDYKFIKKENAISNCLVMRMNEASNGKDTMTGHWEMMGIKTTKPFKTFTDTGFPKELIDELENRTGYKVIGNKAASGTEIIKELGERQLKTKELIVYTSSDSVLQIAANEELFPIDELYRICEIARDITMKDEWKVGRIIARPFIGTNVENFVRTKKRHDYALSPSEKTYLDLLKENDLDSIAIGKINDIFNGVGITEFQKTTSNNDGMDKTIEIAKNKNFTGLCFVNLVDFDSEYGHRRNVIGYKNCLEEFDQKLSELLNVLKEDDLLIITADHGNDPTQPGTDHTREQVPAIFYSKLINSGKYEGETDSFALLGSVIAKNFNLLADDISLFINNIPKSLY